MIENLHKKYYYKDKYSINGTVYFNLFDREVSVSIYNDTPIEYAEKCALAMNSLSEETIDIICRAAKKYCLWMAALLAETGGSLDEEWFDMRTPVDENTPAREILKSIWLHLVIKKPKDNSIGYCLCGACGWEPEHGISVVIKDNKVLYVGANEGCDAWNDFSKDDEYNFVNLI